MTCFFLLFCYLLLFYGGFRFNQWVHIAKISIDCYFLLNQRPAAVCTLCQHTCHRVNHVCCSTSRRARVTSRYATAAAAERGQRERRNRHVGQREEEWEREYVRVCALTSVWGSCVSMSKVTLYREREIEIEERYINRFNQRNFISSCYCREM